MTHHYLYNRCADKTLASPMCCEALVAGKSVYHKHYLKLISKNDWQDATGVMHWLGRPVRHIVFTRL